MLLMRQGEQAWLLLGQGGNHEFARAFYFDSARDDKGPRYVLRDGVGKLGAAELQHLAIERDGAFFEWSTGHRSFIPANFFQLTWKA